MKFSELKIKDKFYFIGSCYTYRKVSKRLYAYDDDDKAVWKFWTPDYTQVKRIT